MADPNNYVRDYEEITVSTDAIGLTAAKVEKMNPKNSRDSAHVLVTILVETANIRFRIDGTNPTATVGDMLYAGSRYYLDDYFDAVNFKAIRDTAATVDATLRVRYKVIR